MTEFGRYLRIIRINIGDSARDMAKKLMLSPSYLSAIENGKRNIPIDFEKQLIEAYNLSEKDKENLRRAILNSSDTIRINLTEYAEKKQRLLMAIVGDEIGADAIDKMVGMLDEENK
ncbi:MAG: helix-turn-helix domain-containing protein [Clostridia bacterium]|nr:helix-turn-helix domain-containing protein [Clostridia bacterium]